jgi:hypothetical protein
MLDLYALGFKAHFLLLYNLNGLFLIFIRHELHLRLIII